MIDVVVLGPIERQSPAILLVGLWTYIVMVNGVPGKVAIIIDFLAGSPRDLGVVQPPLFANISLLQPLKLLTERLVNVRIIGLQNAGDATTMKKKSMTLFLHNKLSHILVEVRRKPIEHHANRILRSLLDLKQQSAAGVRLG